MNTQSAHYQADLRSPAYAAIATTTSPPAVIGLARLPRILWPWTILSAIIPQAKGGIL